MVVQHNMQAANANRMLNVTTSAQSKSTEKLSSGYRINRAADDAAGLTISEKMRKQIRGLDQASTNAQDGVSSVQTAEGALTEVHSMLQRMNELATQAANGTNSKDSDRQAIQDEIDQLTTEIDRVSETTKFNETYLLKGEAGTKTINMKAHDAGLKGTLTDNGDGTATFVMDALNAGDKVSIGGKSYTIGATKADTDKLIDKALADTTHGYRLIACEGSNLTIATNQKDARLLLYNYCELITTHVIKQMKNNDKTKQVNFTIAIYICREYLRNKRNLSPPDVINLIEKHVLPVRPGRKDPRKVKPQASVSFLYRVA
jgi:flagellin-like hook-associated protein FlgL